MSKGISPPRVLQEGIWTCSLGCQVRHDGNECGVWVPTHEFFIAQHRILVQLILWRIQKATKQIISLLCFSWRSANFHHLQHVLLFKAWGVNDMCVITSWDSPPSTRWMIDEPSYHASWSSLSNLGAWFSWIDYWIMCEGHPWKSFDGQEEQRGHYSTWPDAQILVSAHMSRRWLKRNICYLRRL